MFRLLVVVGLFLAVALPLQGAAADYRAAGIDVDEEIAYVRQQALRTDDNVPKGRFPHGGECFNCPHWKAETAPKWISGFLPGMLFMLSHQAKLAGNTTMSKLFQRRALARVTNELKAESLQSTSHDVGFKIFLSCGYGYFVTGTNPLKVKVMEGAKTLARRYNKGIQAIKAWDPWRYNQEPIKSFKYPVIIDTLMNLEILLWAAKNGGRTDYREIAINHAVTTIKEFIREDGCVWHTVDYDIKTNSPILRTSLPQSYTQNSTWSRGQAWAILGFATIYKYTMDNRFLEAAETVTKCYLKRINECCSKDRVPPFDFDYPKFQPDTSAAAIVAAGLTRLSKHSDSNYIDEVWAILRGLNTDQYTTKGKNFDAVLLRGFGDYKKTNEDVPLIYGDFYYLQTLLDMTTQMLY